MSEPLTMTKDQEERCRSLMHFWDGCQCVHCCNIRELDATRAALQKAGEALADERDIKERALGFGVYVEEKLEKLEEVARELLAALKGTKLPIFLPLREELMPTYESIAALLGEPPAPVTWKMCTHAGVVSKDECPWCKADAASAGEPTGDVTDSKT